MTLLVQLKGFNRHKALYTTLLMIIPNILMVIGVVYFTQMNTYSVRQAMQDKGIIIPFYPFYLILVNTFSLSGLLSICLMALLLFIMYQLTLRVIIPRVYAFSLNTDTNESYRPNKTKKTTYQSLNKQLTKYNLSLLKNPTLIMQLIATTVIFPMIFLLSAELSMPNLSNLSMDLWITCLLIGFAYGSIGINTGSMVSVIISLDRENFLFVRSLPLRFKNYLYNKFCVAIGIQLVVSSISILLLTLVLRLPVAHIFAALLGNLLSVYLFGLFYFYRDYRFLSLNWGNVTELFNRGSGSWGQVIAIVCTIISAIFITVAITLVILFVGFASIITLVVLIIFAVITILETRYYQQNFFNKFT